MILFQNINWRVTHNRISYIPASKRFALEVGWIAPVLPVYVNRPEGLMYRKSVVSPIFLFAWDLNPDIPHKDFWTMSFYAREDERRWNAEQEVNKAKGGTEAPPP